MLKTTETAVDDKTNNEAANKAGEVNVKRRGRPPKKKTISKKRGRPKGSTTKNRATNKDREVKTALREQIKQMRDEIRSTKLEFKEVVKKERAVVKDARKELKDALKREQALLKLFELKDKAVSTYANRWTAERITMIQSPTKRRRRRRKAS